MLVARKPPHRRGQALYGDCNPEDAARRIEANLPLARMPLFDSQRGVDAPWLFEARDPSGPVRPAHARPVCESPPCLCVPPKRRGSTVIPSMTCFFMIALARVVVEPSALGPQTRGEWTHLSCRTKCVHSDHRQQMVAQGADR